MAKPKPEETVPGIPELQSQRIRLVGETVYGETEWRSQIARGIAIGRSSLYRYLAGKRSASADEIDEELLKLMTLERLESERRGRRILRLEKRFRQHVMHIRTARARS